MTWNDITVEQYLTIRELNQYEDRSRRIIKYLQIEDEQIKALRQIEFLSSPIPIGQLKTEYQGKALNIDFKTLSYDQWISWLDLTTKSDKKAILGCFKAILPNATDKDIMDMGMVDAHTLYCFFKDAADRWNKAMNHLTSSFLRGTKMLGETRSKLQQHITDSIKYYKLSEV